MEYIDLIFCTILNAQHFIKKKKNAARNGIISPSTKWRQTILGVLICMAFFLLFFEKEINSFTVSLEHYNVNNEPKYKT